MTPERARKKAALDGPRVLVATHTWLWDRRPLAVVRSLARSGATVHLGSDQFYGQAYFSRHRRRVVRYPSPMLDERAFIEALLRLGQEPGYDVLLPTSDYTTLAVSRHLPQLEPHFRIPCTGFQTIGRIQDKHCLAQFAREVGVETPRTWSPQDANDAKHIWRTLAKPCVFKLRRGAGSRFLKQIRSEEDIDRAYAALPTFVSDLVFDFDRPLLQEYVPGEGHDVCCLFSHGEPRAALTQVRSRCIPRDGGVGIEIVTTDEPDLRERAITLLRALGWHGVAQVEFRVDPISGKAHLIEINPRFWGTVDGSIHAGVDFPALACRLAIDGDVEPVSSYRVGARFSWPLPMNVLAALSDRPHRIARRSATHPAQTAGNDLRLDDPLPHIVQALQIGPAWLDYISRKRKRRRAAKKHHTDMTVSTSSPAQRSA